MNIKKTKGLIAAPPTPLKPDDSVNMEIIPMLARLLQESGVIGAFVNGTTGEGFSLTLEERMAIAEEWVNAVPAGFRIIVHVAHTCPISAGELASHAEKIGAFGIAEIGPIFFKPKTALTLAECAARTASHAPNIPYYYYHIPSMSGVNLPMIDFLRAAEPIIPNLAGIKFTYENLVDFTSCLRFREGRYDILYGRDETLLCGLALGAKGGVGSTYNIMAPLYNRLIEAFDSGDLERARSLQDLSMKIITILSGTSCFFSALKEIMKGFGLDMGSVRRPLVGLSPEEIAKMKKDLDATGFPKYAGTTDTEPCESLLRSLY